MRYFQTKRTFTIQSLACAVLVALLAIADIPAVTSQTWRQREQADFQKGEPESVSLSADGALRLSPPMEVLYETPQPYVWALARDATGMIYAAGGNDGMIYRITAEGEVGEFYRIDEPEVSALAVGPDRVVYAGSVPGGRIYRIQPDGSEAWASETKEEYIWSLVIDGDGNLYAGTGLDGKIFKFDPKGKGHVLFDSAETHIRTIRLDGDGNLIAGSDGHGLVYRISQDGEPFVLYDAPLDEVTSLALGVDGTIYAAVIGRKGRSRERKAPLPAPKPKARPSGEAISSGESEKQSEAGSAQMPREQRVPLSMEGKVLAISEDGYAREIWSGNQEAIFCLETTPDGRLLMGSSVQGRIYAYDPKDGSIREIARLASSQITTLLTVEDGSTGAGRGNRRAAAPGDVLVGGSNLGAVALLRQGYASSGTFRSEVRDARSFATWGRLSWKGDLPKGTSIAISARTGNTEEPDQTWSGWSEPLPDPRGSVLDRPSARFMQWRATLNTSDSERTPVLREVSVTYLQRNLPPEISKVEVQAPGITFQKVPASGPRGQKEGGPAAAKKNQAEGNARRTTRVQGRRGFDPGARSVTWQAIDPNHDALRYDVYFRAVDEKTWKPVRTHIEEAFVTLDSMAMPDGTYQFRVVASDAASNPAGEALTAETLSSQFDVDNTPPRVEDLKVSVRSSEIRIVFTARDTFSLIREVAYSIDAGEWVTASPVDGMHDASEEMYELMLPSAASGEHTLVVRATDASGNIGASRAVFEVP
ncbi:MAG: PQQ-binding-like beta-propeller repeat protein [Acidobacteria bacterium]|nr:PQQ-binding-like beta-propeller repeat protein [Acidobacteriota bacterium]